jgi:hypothetical protein
MLTCLDADKTHYDQIVQIAERVGIAPRHEADR